MEVIKYPLKKQWQRWLQRPTTDMKMLENATQSILDEVKFYGDEAVLKYTLEFDKAKINRLTVSKAEIAAGISQCPQSLQTAIRTAAHNIHIFHETQKETSRKIETMPGVYCWRKSVAVEKVGLYIPAGTAPLFSTILMLGIPAKIAGCSEIILCTPPNRQGEIHPAILFSVHLLGIEKIFKAGGVQAIAAMSFGTESIPKTHKIFGPGNQYVTCAKQLVSKAGAVAIDLPAGPSEVAVIADETAKPAFVAADLLSQAEHGEDSQVIVVSSNETIVEQTIAEIEKQLDTLPRKAIASAALAKSRAFLLKSRAEIIDLINTYAPEHLIIASENFKKYSDQIANAGSVFLGNYTPESVGDYASGTNHTLPTNGYATAYSGVSLDSFVKKITFQYLTKEGIRQIGATVVEMAQHEQLVAHQRAVELRLKSCM